MYVPANGRGIYDEEDKEWTYWETTTLTIKKDIEVPVKALFTVIDQDDFLDDVEILEFNNDKKLIFEPDRRHDD